ncbi:MAG: hypothetical protein H8D34_14070 [Chloroflexi bacterium]|nr:hypothetical protein [Chloroflexota bacterium]MBL7164831.1 hypothetical protein [Anaerolineales bacterium]
MGKRNNKVWIEGLLSIKDVGTTELDGKAVPVVQGIIASGSPELGGHHHFVAYGRLAVETIAFVQAGDEDGPPQALVTGWLRSMALDRNIAEERVVSSVVVADNITFVVNKEVRTRANTLFNQALQGEDTSAG